MALFRSRLAGGLAALALVAAACAGDGALEQAGPPVPDRSFETFGGDTVSLADFEGEPMVVNFWASWCPPCLAEMPDFERVHQDLRDEVVFIGLNTQDAPEAALDMVRVTGVTYELGADPEGALARDFEVVSMPSTYFVTADGVVVHRHAGLMTEQQLRDVIDEHLTS